MPRPPFYWEVYVLLQCTSHFLVLSVSVHVVRTFLSLHAWANGLTNKDGARDTWTVSTTNTEAALSECVLLRIVVEIAWLTSNLGHVDLLHWLVFCKILFHGRRRSIVYLINGTHMPKFLLLRMQKWHVSARSATLLIVVRRSNIHYLLIGSWTTWLIWNKTLMLWHFGVNTTDHDLSRVRTPPNWTDVCLLYMIVGIEIWIDLNMIIISARLLWLYIAEERCVLHITVERTLRNICQLWWIICVRSNRWLLLVLQPLTTEEVAIAMTLYLILLLVLVLSQVASSVGGRLIQWRAQMLLLVVPLIHERAALIAEVVVLRRLLVLLLFVNILLAAIVIYSLIMHGIKHLQLLWCRSRILHQGYFHPRRYLVAIVRLVLRWPKRLIALVIDAVHLRVHFHQVDIWVLVAVLWRGAYLRQITRGIWLIILMFSVECCPLLLHSRRRQHWVKLWRFVRCNHRQR